MADMNDPEQRAGRSGRLSRLTGKLALLANLDEQHGELVDRPQRVGDGPVERFDHLLAVVAPDLVVPRILRRVPLGAGGLLGVVDLTAGCAESLYGPSPACGAELSLTFPLEGEVGGASPPGGGRASLPASSLTPHPLASLATSPSRGEVKEQSWLASDSRLTVLDCFTFSQEDESHPGALPHTWAVTTDSIAARVAAVYRAERLILLKSVDIPPGTPWETAAANGWVDAYFPRIAPSLPCPVEVRNFRRKLETRA
jgi:hypothetical protein